MIAPAGRAWLRARWPPVPDRDLADGVQLGVGFRAGVLLGHPGAKLDVVADRFAERLFGGQPGLVEGLQVRRDEPLSLLIGDVEMPVHVDDVLEAELAAEAVGPPE